MLDTHSLPHTRSHSTSCTPGGGRGSDANSARLHRIDYAGGRPPTRACALEYRLHMVCVGVFRVSPPHPQRCPPPRAQALGRERKKEATSNTPDSSSSTPPASGRDSSGTAVLLQEYLRCNSAVALHLTTHLVLLLDCQVRSRLRHLARGREPTLRQARGEFPRGHLHSIGFHHHLRRLRRPVDEGAHNLRVLWVGSYECGGGVGLSRT